MSKLKTGQKKDDIETGESHLQQFISRSPEKNHEEMMR